MAYLATKKNEYWTQLAILAAITGGGFILAALVSSIPLLMNGDLKSLVGASEKEIMKKYNRKVYIKYTDIFSSK